MANQVTLPRLGQGMESGTITRWLKSEGDPVEKGEPLYELDTEKVTQEVEADASGVLLKILVSEGEVEVGKPVAVIGEEGEEVSVDASGDGAAPEAEAEDPTEVTEDEPVEEGQPGQEREDERERGREASTDDQPTQLVQPAARADGGRVKASPLARRLAKERGVDLSSISGTGPEGRIVAEDVERAVAAPAAPAPAAAPVPAGEVETVKLSQMRRTIARRLNEAWQTPHFQVAMSADMRAAMRLREALVARLREGDAKSTFSDVLTKACAVALMRHREVNAHFGGDEVRLFPSADIGIAVAVPGGLLVPVLRGCERRTIQEIANERAELVERTRAGKLQQGELEGGTFTISNLGMYGVERFVAVLNPPQAAILAVGAIEERAVVEAGEIVGRPLMEMTLSCDHRAIDGATASEFLHSVKELLEEPGLMA
ncbi:MAG: 2-oxo acid dehydrogenase subunit E2 [Actinomycetota bacterium]|nr:2-oxo acid dehydrogenase subunit E2 [Actinomycetota bacterium]